MGTNLNTYILLTEKEWHWSLFDELKDIIPGEWFLITTKQDFNVNHLSELNPAKIFIPHWSHIIQEEIYKTWECIVFHMTDLPFGRGGSPLQNLIGLEKKDTMISAIRVEQGIDTGPVYLKSFLSLEGTAYEIFLRSSRIIFQMIKDIIDLNPVPQDQVGEVVLFNRRKPEDGNLINIDDLVKLYDYIRMLDCPGYPNAFIETKNFKFEFSDATISDNYIDAHVRIAKK